MMIIEYCNRTDGDGESTSGIVEDLASSSFWTDLKQWASKLLGAGAKISTMCTLHYRLKLDRHILLYVIQENIWGKITKLHLERHRNSIFLLIKLDGTKICCMLWQETTFVKGRKEKKLTNVHIVHWKILPAVVMVVINMRYVSTENMIFEPK